MNNLYPDKGKLKEICDANILLGIALANLQYSNSVDRKVIDSLPWLFNKDAKTVFSLNAILEKAKQLALEDNYNDGLYIEDALDFFEVPWLQYVNPDRDNVKASANERAMPQELMDIDEELEIGSTIKLEGIEYMVIYNYGLDWYLLVAPKHMMIYNEPKKTLAHPISSGYSRDEIIEITRKAKLRHSAITGRHNP